MVVSSPFSSSNQLSHLGELPPAPGGKTPPRFWNPDAARRGRVTFRKIQGDTWEYALRALKLWSKQKRVIFYRSFFWWFGNPKQPSIFGMYISQNPVNNGGINYQLPTSTGEFSGFLVAINRMVVTWGDEVVTWWQIAFFFGSSGDMIRMGLGWGGNKPSWIFDIAPYQTLSHLGVIFLIDSLSKDLFFWRSSFLFGFPKEEWTWLDWLKNRFRFYTVLDKVGWWTLTPICRWQPSLFRSPYPPPFPTYGVESQSILRVYTYENFLPKHPCICEILLQCDSSQATFLQHPLSRQ